MMLLLIYVLYLITISQGVKRTDYPRLIELLGARLGRPLPPAVASTTASSMAGAVPTAAAAAAMSSNVAAKLAQAGNTSAEVMKNATADAGVKINENFKKFAAAMEIKGTWLNKSGGKP